jgi:hypothetical protein
MPDLLDQAQTERFRRDGFLTFVPGVPNSEVRLIREMLEGLHSGYRGFSEGALFDAVGTEDGDGLWRFPQILHPRSFAPQLVRGEFFRIARAISRQLLGPNVRFKTDISFRKPARIGAETPWHQDEAFLDPRWDYNEVSFWLALQPTDRRNSCMEYIPGTHLNPVLPHGFPGGDSRVHALECVDGFDPDHRVPCELPTGGCVIHTNRTLHYAGPNLSDSDRFAYVLIFNRLPTRAHEPREFPWLAEQHTARAAREREWQRKGGMFVHLWRQKSRIRPQSLIADLHRTVAALRHLRRRP